MTLPQETDLVFSGGSSPTPERDYVIQAGGASTDPRDYIILAKETTKHLTSVVYLTSTALNTQYVKYRFEHTVSSVSISSAANDYASLQVGVIKVRSYYVDASLATCVLGVFSGAVAGFELKQSVVSITSPQTQFSYKNRICFVNPYSLGVSSPSANLIQIDLASLSLGIQSSITTLANQYYIDVNPSKIQVQSTPARFYNPYLLARTNTLGVSSPATDLRFRAKGVLPNIAPTSKAFTPPTFTINKTAAINGRVVRHLLCSKPSNATLTLEYAHVADAASSSVLAAFDQAYGTQRGFLLPENVTRGLDTELVQYFNLSNSKLRWFYAERPSVEAVSKGVSRLTVTLKARHQLS